MVVLNFAHPITAAQRGQIAALCGSDAAAITVVDAPSHIDPNMPIVEEVKRIFDVGIAAALDKAQGSDPRTFLVNLPGFAPSAVVLITLWGRTYGQFPKVLRLRSVPGPVTTFEVAEIVELDKIADQDA